MKIAIDISPLTSGHKFRGTGFYVQHLKEALEKYCTKNNEFIFFTDRKVIPRNVDIIHYPYFDPFSLSVPLFPRVKTVVTVLDLIPIIFPKAFPAGVKGNLMWQVQRFALRHAASAIITDSVSAKKDIEKIVGVDAKNVAVTYLAAGERFHKIQDSRFKIQVKRKYNLPEKFALYVGDVTWNKNLPRIVKAATQANVPLVMVGKALVNNNFDATNAWNKDLAEVRKISKNEKTIFTLGFVSQEDLVAIYNLARVFVMPSLYEGFGLPILEAMSCGVPVVTSHESSLKEVAGEGAYIVDPYDIPSISDGLKKVFSNTNLQNELSKKGREQASKFSWKKTAQETLALYEKIY